jgi:hypothetical protein
MASLSRDLRRQLEKTIAGENGARQIAEAGAEQSLQRLAVDRHEPHTSLTPDERTLRNQLRAHGRQLGDKRDSQRGTQTIVHLKQAVAYEHWHRMLFARYLAENDLLLHPGHGVALSLDEVKELALGLRQDWIEVAAEYAQRMLLREVFRPDDPALHVPLPPEKRLELERKLNSLPREIFLADDSLGWVYQFWQRDSKEKINKSEVKVGPDELSPVTQLFTEDYMVLFLLENTLGAWWTNRKQSSDLSSYTWSFLRLNEDGSPVAGTFSGWPEAAKDIRVIDPSMGSGHFLTFALPLLVRMRATEESLPLQDAISAVLSDNLFGLELDPRCSQIAAFNLALTAWKLAGKHFKLPPLNLACSGLGINAREEDWVQLAEGDPRAQETMRSLYRLFANAPLLGSLIDPLRVGANLFRAEFTDVESLLERALSSDSKTAEAVELAVAAKGLISAAQILARRFTLVATNVPYLVKAKQGRALRDFCESYSPDAVSDLATVFLQRCRDFCCEGGSHATVSPQNWLFLKSYKAFRIRLLREQQLCHVATVGSGQTATASWDVLRALVISTRSQASDYNITGVETDAADEEGRAAGLLTGSISHASASEILHNPSARLALGADRNDFILSRVADSLQGLSSGDNQRFQGFFWEFLELGTVWEFQQGAVTNTTPYSGREKVIRWEGGNGQLAASESAAIRGLGAQGRPGVAVTQMRNLPVTLFSGSLFDTNVAVILPRDPSHLDAIWTFCSSPEFVESVRKLDKKLNVTNATFGEIPFDEARWKSMARQEYPHGLPRPRSSDVTQWLFDGLPRNSTCPLMVAAARLVGYRWPRQTGSTFPGCPELPPDSIDSHVDEDGIVCIPSVAGQEPAVARLRVLLQSHYGVDYALAELLGGGNGGNLENWLRDVFFEEHCATFYQRPFVWHLWDGLKDGFQVLINYHRLDRRNLEKLIYSYLGEWLRRQRGEVAQGVEGADTRLAAAEHLQGELKKILEGEAPYDIFVRWKPLKEQPIGWDPDLNDGVRVNIRPWITEARLYRATKPGILRITPNIKYTKDRGKEPGRDPKEFPWFRGSTDRINDHHLSLGEKRRARGL